MHPYHTVIVSPSGPPVGVGACCARRLANSNLIRDDKGGTIASARVKQETVGLFVADDLLSFGIEAQGPAQAV